MAFCYLGYEGSYPPTADFQASSNIFKSTTVSQDSMVGGCAIVKDDADFNCSMAFEDPPSNFPDVNLFDKTIPDLTTECMSSESDPPPG